MFSGWRPHIWCWLSQLHKREITTTGTREAFMFKWGPTKQWVWWPSLYIGNKSDSNEILELLHQQRSWRPVTPGRRALSPSEMMKCSIAATRWSSVEGQQHPQRLPDSQTRVRRPGGWAWQEVSQRYLQSVSQLSSICRQTDRSESVPRTIRRMKITARVESPSPSPMSRTPPASLTGPQQNISLLNLPESSLIPKKLTDNNNNNNEEESCGNIISPPKSPTRMTNISKIGSSKDRLEGFLNQRITSPVPWNQRNSFGADCIERVKSPTQFLNISRGLESPTPQPPPSSLTNRVQSPVEKDSQSAGTYSSAPALTPFRRIQSPLPFLVKSPNSLSPTNGSAVSLAEGKSLQNSTNSSLVGSHSLNEAAPKASICDQFGFVCDEPLKQEGKISGAPEIKMKSLTQEVIKQNIIQQIFSQFFSKYFSRISRWRE